jgi:ATP/maltotriose-dependent transcriptional regulator MalT
VGDTVTEMRSLRELGGDIQVGRGGATADCVRPLHAALALAGDLGDHRMQINCLGRLCVVRSNMLRFDEGVAHGRAALDIARVSGDELGLAIALDGLKMAAAYMGDVEHLAPYVEELDRILRRHGELSLLVWTLFESSVVPAAAGRFADAVAAIRSAADLSERIGESRMSALVPVGWAWIERARGAYADALRLAEAGARLAEDSGHPWFTAFGHTMLAWIWTEVGDTERALEHGRLAVAAAERDGVENWLVRADAHLAWAASAAGEHSLAETHADRAEATLAGVRSPAALAFLHGGHAYVATARVRLGQGRHDRVDALLEPLLRAAESAPWLEVVIDSSIVLGRSRLATGRADDGERLLARAADLAERHGFGRATWEANAALAGLRRMDGRVEEAEDDERRAANAIERGAFSLEDPTLRVTLRERALEALGLPPLADLRFAARARSRSSTRPTSERGGGTRDRSASER